MKKYFLLFANMFLLSVFAFGGGYVVISLMRKTFVDKLGWISEEEMLDFAAIAQSSPGAVAVNAAIMVGFRTAKYLGALVAVLGTVMPPLILVTIVSYFYAAFKSSIIIANILNGMRAGVAAVIVDVTASMVVPFVKAKQIISIVIMLITFISVAVLKVNVIYVILSCMFIGIAFTFVKQKRGKKL